MCCVSTISLSINSYILFEILCTGVRLWPRNSQRNCLFDVILRYVASITRDEINWLDFFDFGLGI